MKQATIKLNLARAGGESSGTVDLVVSSITDLGRTGGRTSVNFHGGLVYVTDPDRLIEARLHRMIADNLEHEAELDAVKADAAAESRIQ